MTIIEYLKNLPNMRNTGKVSELEIAVAENGLGLSFAEEYKEILLNLGAIRACGHEINGFTKMPAMNVIELTKSARQFEKIPNDMYVVECLGIDDIMMLQNCKGEVFEYVDGRITLVSHSIQEYLCSSIAM